MIDMFGGTFNEVLRIIEEWQPTKDYRSEAGYRDNLLVFIRKELKRGSIWGPPERHRIRKESGRHLVDIGIDEKIGIELKRKLNTQGKLDRLVGQIRRFMREYKFLVIVLCGHVNKEILDDLRYEFKEYSSGVWGQPQTVIRIVPKPTLQKSREQKRPKSWICLFDEIK